MYSLRLSYKPGELAKILKTLSVAANVKTYDQAVGIAVAQANRTLIENTPKRVGTLRGAWAAGLKRLGVLRYRVSNDRKYAIFVEDGTGLFGPLKRRITPKRSKVLRWEQGGAVIFARSTKGQKPAKMLERSLKDFENRVMGALRATLKAIAGGNV